MSLAIRRLEENGERLPLLFESYKSRGLYHPENIDELNRECCSMFNEENLLPDSFKTILKNEMERLL